MIKGIGTDIVDIRRFKRVVERYGDHFLKKVFTKTEIAQCRHRVNSIEKYAGRWAAKEAFYKALPQTCQPTSTWKSIQITTNGETSKPTIEICGTDLEKMIKKELITQCHLSISHEEEFCLAFVVLE